MCQHFVPFYDPKTFSILEKLIVSPAKSRICKTKDNVSFFPISHGEVFGTDLLTVNKSKTVNLA